MSRTNKSVKNSAVALCFYILTLVLSFFSRKIFLEYLGTEILGLNTTATNLLQFLNLAELGISTAVGFSLYKPIRENNRGVINDIVDLQGHLYRRIAFMIIGGAVILMSFFPLIFKKISLPLWYAYASFGVLLFAALLGYFVNYRQVVLTASQQNFKVLYSYRSVIILKIFVQMWAVYKLPYGYVWWLVAEVVFSIIGSWTLHVTTMKAFPHLKQRSQSSFKMLRKGYPEIVTKIKQIFFHKIAGFALTQASPLIIYAFTTLTVVALYGNYVTIISGILSMMAAMFDSMGAGVGNLVAEGDENKIRKVFCEIFSLRFILSSSLCFLVFMFTPSFISLWIGAEYLLPQSTLLIITINLFISLNRYTVDSFISANGIFSDIWAPIVEALLNVGIAIGLGFLWGLNGVLLGATISLTLVVLMWKPYFLISRKMNGFMKTYIRVNAVHFLVFAINAIFCWNIFDSMVETASENYVNFFGSCLLVMMIFMTISWTLLYLSSPATRAATVRLVGIVRRKKTSR